MIRAAREDLFDDYKRTRNLEKHGFNFASLSSDFFASATIFAAKKDRLNAIGEIDGRAVSVIFRPLGSEGISVVSMRRASVKERKLS